MFDFILIVHIKVFFRTFQNYDMSSQKSTRLLWAQIIEFGYYQILGGKNEVKSTNVCVSNNLVIKKLNGFALGLKTHTVVGN